MEYRLYTTPSFVLARQPVGEANITVWLLTRELGVIRASAQAARSILSKHRYGLQTFSLSTVSVVRGKGGWRITSVVPHRSYFPRLADSKVAVDVVAKLALSIRTLCAGEERQPELYDVFYETLHALSDNSFPDRETRAVERIALLRTLVCLGYIGGNEKLDPFVKTTGYSQSLIGQAIEHKALSIKAINEAFEASHLISTQYA